MVGAALCQLGTLVTTVYLHRALAHRALNLSPGVALVFRVLTWVVTGIRPRQWVAVHRKHHAFTDVEGDPHSPLLEGFATVQFGNVALYRKVARDEKTVARYARDLPADRWDRMLFDHALVGLGIGIALLVLWLGPWAGLLAAGLHTVTYLLLNAAVNAVGHAFGRQPHANTSYNNQWLAWITVGEGLHNNHHAAPTSARLALQPGEIDPGWWVVRLLERRGWATVRHREAKLKTA
ncbi:MAG: fatty acid desaturase [Actinomycetota bacterium]|nr:fatty acid desaturase [Actinomycetota bacterium]